jgi:predicted dehydrogenase
MRFAVLGQGSAGRRHATGLMALGHEVVGFDPDARGDIPMAASLDEALAAADAAVVASPNSMHAEQAEAALRAGAHVLVEKPLASSGEAATAVAELAGELGRVCGVAMNLRFHPGLLRLRELVSSGTLGEVRLACASFGYDLRLWRPGTDHRAGYSARADLGGGIVLDAIHELDYLLWLLGPVASVMAETAASPDPGIDVEDLALAVLRFGSGALGVVDLNFFEPAYRRGCLIAGSEAVASWDWEAATVTVRRATGEDERMDAAYDLADGYREELADFVSAVESGGSPRTPATDGARAVRLADGLKRSAATGRRVEL